MEHFNVPGSGLFICDDVTLDKRSCATVIQSCSHPVWKYCLQAGMFEGTSHVYLWQSCKSVVESPH